MIFMSFRWKFRVPDRSMVKEAVCAVGPPSAAFKAKVQVQVRVGHSLHTDPHTRKHSSVLERMNNVFYNPAGGPALNCDCFNAILKVSKNILKKFG